MYISRLAHLRPCSCHSVQANVKKIWFAETCFHMLKQTIRQKLQTYASVGKVDNTGKKDAQRGESRGAAEAKKETANHQFNSKGPEGRIGRHKR